MLLKGRIKIEANNKGVVLSDRIETNPNSSQVNLSFDSKDIKLPAFTKKLNATSLIKKWKFGIEDSSLSFSATFVAAYKENKAIKINLGKIGDNFSAAMDVFKTNIKASFTKADFGLAVAGGDTKVSLDFGGFGTWEFGFKVADLSTSVKKGLSFTPIQGYGKLKLSSETHKKWFEQYEELMKLTTFKIEIAVKIKTSIGLKPEIGLNKKIESKVAKIIEAQEKIVTTQQTEYLKKQKTFNSLIEKKEKINKLQEETRLLARLIKKEKNPTKKRKLIIQKGRRYVYITKEYKTINEELLHEGAKDLDALKEQVLQKSKKVTELHKKALDKYDQVLDKITKPANKLMVELMQKQASKRFISLMMKAVPGLNLISLAVDIYDVYSIVSDISTAYMEADTELKIDAELEIIANSNVAINDMPKIILTFFYGIGAGGKITELKPKNLEELKAFFNEHFPEGDSSTKFTNFIFNYGDFYTIKKEKIQNVDRLIESLHDYKENYNEGRTSQEGEVIEFDEDEFENADTSNFFKIAYYKIITGDVQEIGTIINVDATGTDTNSRGEERQINFPDDNLLELKSTKILDDETIELKSKEEFILKVEGFKTYRLQKGATFIYNKNMKSITRK
jgi:hypothetical protein